MASSYESTWVHPQNLRQELQQIRLKDKEGNEVTDIAELDSNTGELAFQSGGIGTITIAAKNVNYLGLNLTKCVQIYTRKITNSMERIVNYLNKCIYYVHV